MRALRLVFVSMLLALFAGCVSSDGGGPYLCELLFGCKPPAPAPPPPPPPPPRAAPAPAPDDCASRIVLRGVTFAFDSAEIDPASAVVLDVAAETLLGCPNANVTIEGHTDGIGSEEYNDGLSQRRSNAGVSHLENRGVPSSRLTAVGYGESRPVASNDTEEGRALNRRIELKVQ
jgi:OOP family OmpA-OmpF porin